MITAIISIVASIVAVIGFFTGNYSLVIVGGIVVILHLLLSLLAGALKSVFLDVIGAVLCGTPGPIIILLIPI